MTGGIVDEYMYTISETTNLFLKINILTGEYEYLSEPIGYNREQWKKVYDAVVDGDKVFFLEYFGNHIMEYDTKDNSCHYYLLDEIDKDTARYPMIKHGGFIYCFFSNMPWYIRFDICSKNIEKINIGESISISSIYEKDGIVNIIYENKPKKYILDLVTGKETWKGIPNSMMGCHSITLYGGKEYYIGLDKRLYVYDGVVNHSINKYEYDIDGKLVIMGKGMYIFPATSSVINFIEFNNGRNSVITHLPTDLLYMANDFSKFCFKKEYKDIVVFFPHDGNYLVSVNLNSGEIQWIKPNSISAEKYLKDYFKDNAKQYPEGLFCLGSNRRIFDIDYLLEQG